MESLQTRLPTTAKWYYAANTAALALGFLPLVVVTWNALTDRLGANPIEALEQYTGWWTLTLLLAGLAVTPIRRVTGWPGIGPLRRTLGLLAFFWANLHVAAYVGLDQFFSFQDIVADVTKRPNITVGFAAFLLLIPLAATSTDNMMRRLGVQRWRRLHRLVYLASVGGVLHFLWLVKADLSSPVLYIALLVLLLSARLGRNQSPRPQISPGREARTHQAPPSRRAA